MARRRKRMSRRASRRFYMKNTVPKRKNMLHAIPMRGGFRL